MNRLNRVGRLMVESLEDRTLMAGNVLAYLTGGGGLVLRGDVADNVLAVEQTVQGAIQLYGLDDTTINGQSASVALTGFTGGMRASMGKGHDSVHVNGLETGRAVRVRGSAGFDTVTLSDVVIGRGEHLKKVENVQHDVTDQYNLLAGVRSVTRDLPTPGLNVMQLKLNQAIQTLQNTRMGEDAYRQAIEEGMEALYTSNLVILPTQGAPAADPVFTEHVNQANALVDALTQFVNNTKITGAPGAKADGIEARNFIQIQNEAMQGICGHTFQTDPNNPTGPLAQDDEAGTVVDNVYAGFQKLVRYGNMAPSFFALGSVPEDDAYIIPSLANGEAAAIIQKYQGVCAVVRPFDCTVYAQPWYRAQTVVGLGKIWVWEYVPAEYIKTIAVVNNAGVVTTTVSSMIVLDRGLLPFWRFKP